MIFHDSFPLRKSLVHITATSSKTAK